MSHPSDSRALLNVGSEHQRQGRLAEAFDAYAGAVESAGPRDAALQSEALRHLAVLHHLRAESETAREYAERALDTAVEAGASAAGAEALNALGGFAFEAGRYDEAQEHFERALEMARREPSVALKVEHNLGILHNVRGEWREAALHYERAAQGAEATGDRRAAALAYHNLGMLSADHAGWEEAHRYYRRAVGIAIHMGDKHLEGLCLLNQAEVYISLEQWAEARGNAERALVLFDQLDARRDKSDAYRMLGVVFRETSRPALAESRLRSAVEIAVSTACPLSEAEARRELGELYRRTGRARDALTQLSSASSLFSRLGARADLADVDARVERLKAA